METLSPKIPLAGEAALDLLTSAQRGKVLAVVTHAIYLLTDNGELFWLASEASPMHRRCVRLSVALPELAVGSTFEVRRHILTAGSADILDLDQVNVWLPPSISSAQVGSVETLPERVCAVYASICRSLAPAGLGSLIPGILGISNHPCPSHHQPTFAAAKAWPFVAGIARACLAHDFSRIMAHADALVGLGEGLTPSGDDFLGGLLFCRRLFQLVYPHMTFLDCMNYSSLFDTFSPRTNLISLALLKDHAEGSSNEYLHGFANALLAGQPLDQLRLLASGLIRIGHSTGWDLLTGFLAGMLLVFQADTPFVRAHRYEPYQKRKEIQWISNRR